MKIFRLQTAVSAGLLTGLLGVILSFAGRGLIPGRVLGDPLPLALAFGQITRSFLYFNWRGLVWHLVFAAFLGVVGTILLRWLSEIEPTTDEVAQTAAFAALINLGIVALMEIDALMVAIWYLLASFISYSVTTIVARWAGHWLAKRS